MKEISNIFSIQDDDEMVGALVKSITGRPDFSIAALTPVERTVVAVVAADGIIANGGFQYFFEMDFEGRPDYLLFVEAYCDIGATKCSRAMQSGLELFPSTRPPDGARWREDYYANIIGGKDHPVVAEAERTMFSELANNMRRAAKYARSNYELFPEIIPT